MDFVHSLHLLFSTINCDICDTFCCAFISGSDELALPIGTGSVSLKLDCLTLNGAFADASSNLSFNKELHVLCNASIHSFISSAVSALKIVVSSLDTI